MVTVYVGKAENALPYQQNDGEGWGARADLHEGREAEAAGQDSLDAERASPVLTGRLVNESSGRPELSPRGVLGSDRRIIDRMLPVRGPGRRAATRDHAADGLGHVPMIALIGAEVKPLGRANRRPYRDGYH